MTPHAKEPKPRIINAIMVETMKHIDQAFIEQQKPRCRHNWNYLIGPIALHIDDVEKQDHGYDTRMLEMLAACIKMMQCHHKALLLGPCMDEFKRHLASLEPPQHYDYNIHNHQFRAFQKTSKVMVDSHCNYGMFGCWQPAFDLKLAFVVHIKVPCFVPHSQLTIQQATHDIWETCFKLGKKACV